MEGIYTLIWQSFLYVGLFSVYNLHEAAPIWLKKLGRIIWLLHEFIAQLMEKSKLYSFLFFLPSI